MLPVTPCVCLLGWPGAGKTRLLNGLQANQALNLREAPGLVFDVRDDEQGWVVIDARSPIEDKAELTQLMNAGDAIVLMFWQEVTLDQQAWWLEQLKQMAPQKPYATSLYESLSGARIKALLAAPKAALNPGWPELQSFEFSLPKVVLEHLMFVLDSAKQNLAVDFWRVQAVLNTQEYVNPVALEGTRFRWDTFGADKESIPIGQIRIVGRGLNENDITAWLDACHAPAG
ncbi:MAG: hypothetical protein IBX48_03225 [Thiomicrospira sp.]|uniref:hypothetical protein n=1 Tax=Thiomicrospira sp. TaxID=935 RepID=UPI0019D87F13|nr:hypothetical protein [Thiomicrospira sp.]MBE0493332.1 hypothetical protein [Thiomicrospira sp.]